MAFPKKGTPEYAAIMTKRAETKAKKAAHKLKQLKKNAKKLKVKKVKKRTLRRVLRNINLSGLRDAAGIRTGRSPFAPLQETFPPSSAQGKVNVATAKILLTKAAELLSTIDLLDTIR